MRTDDTRPSEVLDEWLEKYGYDKYRATGKDHKTMCYVRIANYENDEWYSFWAVAGVADNPLEALASAFELSMKRIVPVSGETFGEHTPYLEAIILMAHGEGGYCFQNPDTNEECGWDDLTDEQQQLVRESTSHNLHELLSVGERVNTRMVNIITPTGLAAEVSSFYQGQVFVERHEQWTEDGEDTQPEVRGAIDEAMLGTFTFVHLIREAVSRNKGTSIPALIETATELSNEGAGSGALAYLLKVVATGVESGLLDGLGWTD